MTLDKKYTGEGGKKQRTLFFIKDARIGWKVILVDGKFALPIGLHKMTTLRQLG